MNFKNNFTEDYLLTNKDVIFTSLENDLTFMVKIPKFYDIYFNNDLFIILGFLEKDIEVLVKDFPTFQIKSHFDYLYTLFLLSEKVNEIKEIWASIKKGLKFIIPDLSFENKVFKIKNSIVLTEEIFKEIKKIILLSLNKKVIEIEETDDEFTKIDKQARLRAERIRRNSKNKDNEKDGLKTMLIAILYEFPQYKLEDLWNLNLYTIYYLFSYIGKIANYEVSKIAAGTGNAKRHKYFIEK
jgi:hypothetical protein